VHEAHLPHPAMLYLELQSQISQSSASEGATLDALGDYVRLSEVQLASLWAVIARRAEVQEQAVTRILEKMGVVGTGAVAGTALLPNGLRDFLDVRAAQASSVAVLTDPGSSNLDMLDPIWNLDVEGAFLGLGELDQCRWLRPEKRLRANWAPLAHDGE